MDDAPDTNRSKGCKWNACVLAMVMNLARKLADAAWEGIIRLLNSMYSCVAIARYCSDITFHRCNKKNFDVDDD